MLKENRVHFPHLPLSDATSEGRAPWSPDLWEAEMLGATLKLGWRRLDAHPRHHFTLSCGYWLEKAHLQEGLNAEVRYKEPKSGWLLSGLAKAACIAMVFGCGLYYIKEDLEGGEIACKYEDLSFILEPT